MFYSSDHFDSVLATAFMLLSAVSRPSGGRGCGGAGVDADSAANAASSVSCTTVGKGTASAGGLSARNAYAPVVVAAGVVASTADSKSAAAAITPPGLSLGPTDVADSIAASSSYGSPFSRDKSVFLTAYHERSARRSLRPLLRKWGMEATVLHDAPRQVLPPILWESGRYDSVALLEITLMQ